MLSIPLGILFFTIGQLNAQTLISGQLDASSFATKVDYPTGSGPAYEANGDLDNDGYADVVVANSSSNSISIYRNTSSVGAISFAGKFDLVTGNKPQAIAIGDLDNDGYLDLVVTNLIDNTLNIFSESVS